MTGFVLDASMTVAWCFGDEATPETRALLRRVGAERAVAPAIWALEVANILAMGERRGRLDAAGVTEFLGLLDMLDIRIDDAPASRGLREILDLARRERLSSYDAAYLDLAMREGLPLATRDAALAAAAQRVGTEVILA